MVVESWGIGRADFSNVTTVSGILGISGEVHVVSGEIALQSGVFVSGTFILVESGIYFASGLGVLVSGQMVSVASGAYVVADIAESGMGVTIQSGAGVQVQSGVEIIWRGVQVSGAIAISGSVTMISGIIDIKTPTDILIAAPNNPQVVGAISGGIPLTSGAIISVIVKALTINSGDIYAGGYKTGHRPYSGVGFLLEPGDAMSINIDDIGKINVFAAISGDQVTYMGNA